jgi:hypothetical protein
VARQPWCRDGRPVAADDASIAGLVLGSGAHDLPAYAADADATAGQRAVVAAMIAETGGTLMPCRRGPCCIARPTSRRTR